MRGIPPPPPACHGSLAAWQISTSRYSEESIWHPHRASRQVRSRGRPAPMSFLLIVTMAYYCCSMYYFMPDYYSAVETMTYSRGRRVGQPELVVLVVLL